VNYSEEDLRQMQVYDPRQYALVMEMQKLEEEFEEASTLIEDEPKNEPQEETVEEPKEEVVKEEVAETEEPETESFDIEYWKKKGDELEALVKPEGQPEEATSVAEKVDDKLKTENDELKKRLEALEALVNKSKEQSEDEEDDDDVLEYTRENFPELERRIAKAEKLAADRAKKEIEEALAERLKPLEDLRSRNEEEKQRAFAARHFSEVQAAHSDAADYFDDSKLGKAFKAWAQTQPKLIKNAALYPLSNDSSDVAYVLNQFKREAGLEKRKAPAAGDLASSVGKAGLKAVKQEASNLLSDAEIRNIDKLMSAAAARSNSEFESLLERYDKTLASKEK
jgi:hypothetical protein